MPSYLSNVKLIPHSIAQVLKLLNIKFSFKWCVGQLTKSARASVKKKNRRTQLKQTHEYQRITEKCQPRETSHGHRARGWVGCFAIGFATDLRFDFQTLT